MARERKLTVILAGDSKGLDRALGSANRSVGGLGSKLGGLAKTAAIGFGALTAGAVVIGKGLVDAATESAKVTAQTNAVLKSMGNVAGVTADQVADLSEKLSLKSGVDDELIQSSQNVLLTFGKVRNELGKGNKVFDRATAAALDMSVALGTDMQGATIQIGKALNDPIKGITALSRAGVSFTKEQKEQIKTLVESGRTLDAQKIILGELEKQFGGSAEAQATAADKLKVAWGNIQEQLGEKLLPIFEKVAGFLADNLPRAMEAAGRAVRPLLEAFDVFKNAFAAKDDFGLTGPDGLVGQFAQFGAAARRVFDEVAGKVREWWPRVVAGFQAVAGWVQQNWPKIQQIIGDVMNTVGSIVAGAVSVITTLWNNFGNNILSFVQRVWPRVQQIIEGALKIIRGIVQTITSLIKGDWSGVWNGIKGIVSGAWQAIQGIIGGALEAIRGVLGIGLEIVGSIFKGAWNGLVGWFWSIPSKVRDVASHIWESLKSGLAAAIRWIRGQLDKLLGPLDEIAGKVGGIVGKAGGLLGKAGGLVGKIPGFATGGVVPGPIGAPQLAVVHGGEEVRTRAQRAAGASSAAGNTYQITLNVAPTADLASVGKTVVEAISAYERRSGARWRAS